MRKQITNGLTIAVVAMAMLGVNTNAADITYEGHQAALESTADDPTAGWRNSTPAKPLDLDGDNILGSDGYYGFNTLRSQPSYISSWQHYQDGGNNWNASYGVADDPADPAGADTSTFGRWKGTGGPDGSVVEFTITGSDLAGKVLTVGVLFGTWAESGTFELRQTAGGSGTDTSPSLSSAGGAMDAAYFNVTGATAGDTFVVITSWNVMGFTFDTSGGGSSATPGTLIYGK